MHPSVLPGGDIIGRNLLLISDRGPVSGRGADGRLPFGAERLHTHGFLVHNPHRAHTPGLRRKLRDVIEHRTGVLIEDGLKGIGKDADVVLALFENNASMPILLRKLGCPPYSRAVLAVVVCWATEEMRHLELAERRRRLRELDQADLIFVLSQNQVHILAEWGLPADKLHAVPFGIDGYSFYAEADSDRTTLVAIGQDRGRDYATLARAVGGTGLDMDLHCKPENVENLHLPPEIHLRGVVPTETYKRILHSARAVVVPTHDLAYPTGQSVALEAAAAGALVIGTATDAFSEYFQHGSTALLSKPYDAEALRANIRRAVNDGRVHEIAARGQKRALDRYTSVHMWDKIAAVLTGETGTNGAALSL